MLADCDDIVKESVNDVLKLATQFHVFSINHRMFATIYNDYLLTICTLLAGSASSMGTFFGTISFPYAYINTKMHKFIVIRCVIHYVRVVA